MTKKKYRIQAQYLLRKELEVEVAAGLDPNDPNNWQFVSEHDTDCQLYDNDAPVEVEDF